MNAFGTSELASSKVTKRFGETKYFCDSALMITEILRAYDELYAQTARYPCALDLHPVDYQYLRRDYRFESTLRDGVGIAYFMSMRVSEVSVLTMGSARLTVCPGCRLTFGICVHGRKA